MDPAPALFVFDVDGCIVDSFSHFQAFVPRVFEKFNLVPGPDLMARLREEIIALLAGHSSKILIAKLVLHAAKQMGMGRWQRLKFLLYIKQIYKENIDALPFVPGAIETLRYLKETGCKVALFTTGSMKDFKRKFAAKRELLDLVDEITVRDHVRRMKPDPEGITRIQDRLGMRGSRKLVMIGDMHHDILAGISAGGIGVGVLTGVCTREELEQAGAALVLDSIKDVPAHVHDIVARMP